MEILLEGCSVGGKRLGNSLQDDGEEGDGVGEGVARVSGGVAEAGGAEAALEGGDAEVGGEDDERGKEEVEPEDRRGFGDVDDGGGRELVRDG